MLHVVARYEEFTLGEGLVRVHCQTLNCQARRIFLGILHTRFLSSGVQSTTKSILKQQPHNFSCTTVKMVGALLRSHTLRIRSTHGARNEQALTRSSSRSATQPHISPRPNRLAAVAPIFESASRTPARLPRLSMAGNWGVRPSISRM